MSGESRSNTRHALAAREVYGGAMESDADRALRYRQHAEALRKVAATILDLKSQQAIIEAAQHYERLAAALTATPQPTNSN
jgi:hypothetical protein